MAAKNKVIAGDYEGKLISQSFGKIFIAVGFTKTIYMDKDTVDNYEVIDETSQKSAVSAVGRAFVGGVLLGPVGWFAGVTAKSKGTHLVAVQFKDGKKSLLEVNDKIYGALMKKLF